MDSKLHYDDQNIFQVHQSLPHRNQMSENKKPRYHYYNTKGCRLTFSRRLPLPFYYTYKLNNNFLYIINLTWSYNSKFDQLLTLLSDSVGTFMYLFSHSTGVNHNDIIQ